MKTRSRYFNKCLQIEDTTEDILELNAGHKEYNNPYSNEPSDYKCGHILVADGGYLLCQPNNRIYWKDSNFITQDFPLEKQNIKVDNIFESVESYSDRWVSENTDSFYYNINE
jgi:hypothetical protein